MLHIRPSRPDDLDRMYEIWLGAVQATHHFLTEADIASIGVMVRDAYLPNAAFSVVVDAADRPLAFLGMTAAKIDSLFVDPAEHGKGIGRMLIRHAQETAPVLTVDVNEQNPGACAFYQRLGFVITGRSELDDDGRPFPLLHLKLEQN